MNPCLISVTGGKSLLRGAPARAAPSGGHGNLQHCPVASADGNPVVRTGTGVDGARQVFTRGSYKAHYIFKLSYVAVRNIVYCMILCKDNCVRVQFGTG